MRPGVPWRLETPHSRAASPSSPTAHSLLADTPRRRSHNPSGHWNADDLRMELRESKKAIQLEHINDALRSAQPPSSSRIPAWLPAYAPLIIWVAVSLLTALLVGIWHTEVFEGLESLSDYLKHHGASGYAVIWACIVLTTIPPCPFYGTLVVLCGYTFGVWRGFAIAYGAALFGALAVYIFCRAFLRETMSGHLRRSPGMRKVIHACSMRPRLLFLIRLAPYPYNLVNALAAASDQLTLRTYTLCTALALPKLLVHTSIGASIRSWAHYHHTAGGPSAASDEPAIDAEGQRLKVIFGGVGLGLCVVVFLWLFIIARRAVDEADDRDPLDADKTTPDHPGSAILSSVEVDRPR